MVFSDLRFLYIFLPVFFTCYYLAPKKIKNLILVLGSLIFYTVGSYKSPVHIYIFILSVIVDYLVGLLMVKDPNHKKLLLWTGIIYHFICLGYFKYIQFASLELAKHILSINYVIKVALPIGISFYTFQGLSYIIDVYRGKIKAENNLIHYATFISMFEQLIAGPIVTYEKVKDDLKERTVGFTNLITGLEVFIIGLGLKVLIANPLGKVWSQTTKIGFEAISTKLAWMAIIAFSFQLYFDFFGYSMMAIGLGKMLGFTIPQNFNHPYLSRSMSEFWRRWHITLGSWFREYVYIPLGGNRKGILRTIFNLLIVWVFTGVWHGAGYNFILWGFTLFVIMVIERYIIGDFLKKHKILSHMYMLLLIPITWAIFAIDDITDLQIFFTRIFPFFGQGTSGINPRDFIDLLKIYWPFLTAGAIFSTPIPFKLFDMINQRSIRWFFLLVILGGCTYLLYLGYNDPFLYFRF